MTDDSLITSPNSPGFINPTYSRRDMQIYCITENELTSLNNYDKHTTMFASIASGAFSLAIAIILGIVFIKWTEIPAIGQSIAIIGIPIFILLSCVFGWLSFHENKTKKTVIQNIREESKIIPPIK